MALAKKTVGIDKCRYLSEDSKNVLEASSQPPIKLITLGAGDDKLEIGNETVMFRHEEKFHHPCGLGFIIEDKLPDAQIKASLEKINKLRFERIGQQLNVNLIAIKQNSDTKRFVEAVKLIANNSNLGLVLISQDTKALKEALEFLAIKKPLIYSANKENLESIAALCKDYKTAVVVSAPSLEAVSSLTQELSKLGVSDLVLDTGNKSITEKIWDLTQIRRLALKKSNRALGYPAITMIDNDDPYQEAMEAATYICKYAGIILLKSIEAGEILSLLTLRQNIYTDPQKPLQIEPKVYPIGQVTDKSPVLVTTNFSLSYYTVLGEVEASKIPSYIVSIDTEGMSVLTAWAAEKFTPEKITSSLNKFGVKDTVKHNQLIIPGYVAVMSGDLEEQSGWSIVVGPKEAAGIPSFLKNMQ